MVAISIQGLEKRYGELPVLSGIDLEIADGEFVVLVGPSGCGKSTLLRCIAGLNTISGGVIRFGDRMMNGLPPQERNVSMVFQNYALYPHLTVAENMAFGLRIKNVPKDEISRRVAWAAEILSITPYLQRRPRALSGGQRQRVAMGRSMVKYADAFLFDEPLSNLDAKLRVQMRKEIRNLQMKIKTTSIYVTHDQVEAMTMGDRIVVMNASRIEQVGTPLELYENPKTQFVAGFIGSPPMNFLAAESSGREVRLVNGAVLKTVVDHRGPVTVGIRPEHFFGGGVENRIMVPVKYRQELGAAVSYFAEIGGQEIEAYDARPDRLPKDKLDLCVAPERILLFHEGRRL
ncbi:sn-glycerol-3-phosphate ABC transporter ATP-binding protein UgpC [Mesorhizobium sp. VK9D]|uniref:ABC transporter ATP-binding protein n=1 Tax=Mesorhizobium australafricanum TaxID=3072311 RepID=UPI002A242E12|nr:sn-glycerol-3-phosphate ABC transporter ATP-binding protein UgpC [Mesorhizobium sp. VK9D]MDX8454258.1 sn-glycerol-3-phosphate ABC transporter ATP-binding protein UgpC [Mesorhizobium sp. VK9D]